MRQRIRQELRNLMSEGLPQFKEKINNQPKGTDDAPALLVSFGEQCHGDQGKGKWMNKFGYNSPEKSKDTAFAWEIPYHAFNCCPQTGRMGRPAQHIFHRADNKGTNSDNELQEFRRNLISHGSWTRNHHHSFFGRSPENLSKNWLQSVLIHTLRGCLCGPILAFHETVIRWIADPYFTEAGDRDL